MLGAYVAAPRLAVPYPSDSRGSPKQGLATHEQPSQKPWTHALPARSGALVLLLSVQVLETTKMKPECTQQPVIPSLFGSESEAWEAIFALLEDIDRYRGKRAYTPPEDDGGRECRDER